MLPSNRLSLRGGASSPAQFQPVLPQLVRVSMPSFRAGLLLLLVGVLLNVVGCASFFEQMANREGWEILEEKRAAVAAFRRDGLLDPNQELSAPEAKDPPVEVPEVVSLFDAIRIATQHNRDYATRREQFFLNALDLGLTRRDFLRPIFSGTVGYTQSDGRERSFNDGLNLSLGATQFLYTGGTLAVDGSASLNKSGRAGRDQAAAASGGVTLTQPLLQGAGHTIAFEALTQAERSAIYEARDFELFRQDFVIDIINDFYNLVSQKQQVRNLETNIARQDKTVKQAQAFFRVGRGTRVDMLRAQQSYFAAKNNLLDAEQSYELSIDRFKIELGLPISVDLTLTEELPTTVEAVEVSVNSAVTAALHNRLDMRTIRDQVVDQERQVVIRRNALLPQLNLVVSYDTASDPARNFRSNRFGDDVYSATVNLELPLDRRAIRNAYRSAQIGLDRERRALDQFEDNLILEIRNSVRSLRQRQSQIEIESLNITSLKKRVRQAELENRQGSATNRDVVEALDSLTQAENDQLGRYVDYEITRLTLLRQMGILFVSEEGHITQ